MPHRILLVEDDAEIAEFTARGLREEGLEVTALHDGRQARAALLGQEWDLVLLDWWLPGPDGLALLKAFRDTGRTTPVLFLTARDAVAQRIQGLNAGADDYLCKPFEFGELLARVQALLRRATGGQEAVVKHRDVVVDLLNNTAERAGKPLNLTAREQSLLLFFLRNPRVVLSRPKIYEDVWREPYDGTSNTLEVHIMELRRKLEAHGPRIIHTVRGRGYVLDQLAERA
jgi:two-component system copper resistance phosphate regulon response regulator CusR